MSPFNHRRRAVVVAIATISLVFGGCNSKTGGISYEASGGATDEGPANSGKTGSISGAQAGDEFVGTARAAVVVVNASQPADTTAPAVQITSPTNGSSVSGQAVAVTGTATDNVGVAKVEIYVDGMLAATDAAAPYLYNWDTTAVANGAHMLQAKAYDAAGNVGSSALVSVTVANASGGDLSPPTAPTGLSCSKVRIRNQRTQELRCSWNASIDNVAVTGYEVYREGVVAPIATTTALWYQGALVSGIYRVKALDAAGNRSPYSASFKFGK